MNAERPIPAPWPRVGRLRRYGPASLILVALVVFGVLATVAAPGGTGSNGGGSPGPAKVSLPVTYAVAQAAGKTADYHWGSRCDRRTGRIKMPTLYAPPCVPVFNGRNGESTWSGVGAKTIDVVYYEAPPGGLASAVEGAAGTASTTLATAEDFVTMLNHTVELYGRKVQLIPFHASGAGSDSVAAQADAVRVAQQIHAFASIGGPDQTSVYADELARLHVLCIGCANSAIAATLEQYSPYLWAEAPTLDSLLNTAVSYVIDKLVGKRAIWAGEASLRRRKRLFEVVYDAANPPSANGTRLSDEITRRFKQAKVSFGPHQSLTYQLDLTTLPDQAATIAAKLKADRVTTVIFIGDPIMPIYLTRAAAEIGYYPEWVITGTVLTDTTTLGRYYNQAEWAHAFGISALPVPTAIGVSEPYRLYKWWYGEEKTPPAAKVAPVILPPIEQLFLGLELAGPDLTPASFAAGMFGAPPAGGGPTSPLVAYGHHESASTSGYASPSDYTFIWWNARAKGPNEEGTEGTGMVEYVDGGKRYPLGTMPRAAIPMFGAARALTMYSSPPAASRPPAYPPWPGSPTAG